MEKNNCKMWCALLRIALLLCLLIPSLCSCALFSRFSKSGEPEEEPQEVTLTIVYDTDTVTYSKVKDLALAIQERAGITVEVKGRQTGAGQILIGHVDSPDVTAALAELSTGRYVMGTYGNSYVITGLTKAATNAAIDHFMENFLGDIDQTFTDVFQLRSYMGNGMNDSTEAPFDVQNLSLYTILLPTSYTVSELRFAVELQQHLLAQYAVALPIYTDDSAPAGPQIRVGDALCLQTAASETHGYAVGCVQGDLEIAFTTGLGYQAALKRLCTEVFVEASGVGTIRGGDVLRGSGATLASEPLQSVGSLRLMLNNMYGGHQNIHPMAQRTDMLIDVYLTYRPAVLGLQEYSASADSTGFMQKLLNSGYVLVEQPAAAKTNKGQDATPLVYDPTAVTLLSSGYMRFNDLTYDEYPALRGSYTAKQIKDICQDGSKGFDWGIFAENATGRVFMTASVHLWWKESSSTSSTNKNLIARKIQMQVMKDELVAKANAFAERENLQAGAIPIFVGGDYNCKDVSGSPLAQMESLSYNNVFVNTNDLATQKATLCTHHSYPDFINSYQIPGNVFGETNTTMGIYGNMKKNTNAVTQSLDYIFMNDSARGSVQLHRMGVVADDYVYLSTDHNPVYVDITLTEWAPQLTD